METGPVYGLTLTSHLMIAHRMRGERFGPAQRLHGATFAVEVTLLAERLDADGVVADMGRAAEVLAAILAPLDYCDLDELPRFAGRNTTTEVLAEAIHADWCAALRNGDLGADEAERIRRVRVVLRENPRAWASFEAAFCP
jgi:6-pyruvoyl-tetrahydropterin synthase